MKSFFSKNSLFFFSCVRVQLKQKKVSKDLSCVSGFVSPTDSLVSSSEVPRIPFRTIWSRHFHCLAL